MAHASLKKMEVKSRLQSCKQCGAFRGEIFAHGQERVVRVACRCSEGRCPRCRRKLITTPFSQSGDDISGRVWHAPHLGAHCANCGPLYLTEQGNTNENNSE